MIIKNVTVIISPSSETILGLGSNEKITLERIIGMRAMCNSLCYFNDDLFLLKNI